MKRSHMLGIRPYSTLLALTHRQSQMMPQHHMFNQTIERTCPAVQFCMQGSAATKMSICCGTCPLMRLNHSEPTTGECGRLSPMRLPLPISRFVLSPTAVAFEIVAAFRRTNLHFSPIQISSSTVALEFMTLRLWREWSTHTKLH
jgi:hypothetical protein